MKRLLLVGGGHSHLAVLKSFGDAPPKGVRLTFLSPHRHALYSGMIPGLIAGHYSREDCSIDLEPLAARAQARFVRGMAAGIDPGKREAITATGERLPYDFLSLDIGSTTPEPLVATGALAIRPIETFLARWEGLREAAQRGEIRRVALVGGGAAGIEVLLAMRHRLADATLEFALFNDAPILAGHGGRRRIGRILGEHGIVVHAGGKVTAVREDGLEIEGGERVHPQAVVWATGAAAPAWIARTGLRTDPLGFIAVSETLQSLSHPEILAAGDVATVAGEPGPKSGVIAVRQGPVLARNLRLALANAALEPFRPPARALALISCGGRYAVASWGRLAFEGAWVWRWKDRIDRRFVGQYRVGD